MENGKLRINGLYWAYTTNGDLDETSAVTDFPSSGEEGWPTAGVVAAATNALIHYLKHNNAERFCRYHLPLRVLLLPGGGELSYLRFNGFAKSSFNLKPILIDHPKEGLEPAKEGLYAAKEGLEPAQQGIGIPIFQFSILNSQFPTVPRSPPLSAAPAPACTPGCGGWCSWHGGARGGSDDSRSRFPACGRRIAD